MDNFVPPSKRSRSLLCTSFAVSFVAIIVVAVVIGFTAQAANYSAFAAGSVNWTATTVSGFSWGCTTTGGTDSCGAYPGQLPNPGGDTAVITTSGGPLLITVDSNIPNPVTMDLGGFNGSTVDVASGGTLRLAGASVLQSLETLSISGGTLTNNGTLAVTGSSGPSLVLNSGTFDGAGTTNIGGLGGTFNIVASAASAINQQTINNAKFTNFNTGGTVAMGLGATFMNQPGGIFNANGGGTISQGAGLALFNNASTFQKTGGAAFTVGVPFANTGLVSLPATGLALNLLGGSTSSGATWNLGVGGAINFSGSHAFSGAQSFLGTGTLTINPAGSWKIGTPAPLSIPALMNLTNNGTLDLASSPSFETLNVGGNFAQGAAGMSLFKIGPPNGSSDVVNVTGSSTLAGNLTASLGSLYAPVNGDTFTVLTALGTRTADFTTYTLPLFPGGIFTSQYFGAGPENLQLVAAPAIDIGVGKTGPASVLHNQDATYTVSVTNAAGSSTATNVVLSDNFSSGLYQAGSSSPFCGLLGPGVLSCTIPSIAPGATVNLPIVINANTLGTIVNSASFISANEIDTNSANNNSPAVSTTVVAVADLALTKTGPPTAVAGAPLAYTITVNNAGPDTATGLTVTDTMPAGTTAISPAGPGWACSVVTSTVTCTLATLAPGPASPITINANAPAAGGPINNTATVTSTSSDPNGTDNSATWTTTVTASADIGITKTGAAVVTAGQNATYTFNVVNNGPSAVPSVTVNDTPGAGLTFVSATAPCAGGFPCTLPGLASGGSSSFTATFAVSPSATGTVTNGASAAAAGVSDPNSANDASPPASAAVAINSDVQIAKTGPASASPGQAITYSITVTNLGPSTATGVTVSDPTPAQTTAGSVSSSPSLCASLPCTIPTLAPGSSVIISAGFTVNSSAAGSISNSASVTSTSTDSNGTNNTAAAVTTITPQADLKITKSGPAGFPTGGGPVTFTITVSNLGPSTATGVVVNDSPSAGLVFQSNSGACTTLFPCSIASLASGGSVTIQSVFNVAATANVVTNTADVTSSVADPNSFNNSSSVTVGSSCPTGTLVQFVPFSGQQDVPVSGLMQWTNVGGTGYDVYMGPAGSGCATLVASNVSGTSYSYSGLIANTDYESRIVAVRPGCPSIASQCIRWRTGSGPCNLATPQLTAPASGATIGSPTTLQWSAVAGATQYHVVVTVNGNNVIDQTTAATSLDVVIPNGDATWSVIAMSGNCTSPSSSGSFHVCAPPPAPLAGVVGAPSSGQAYSVIVTNPTADNVQYDFQEADNDSFNNATTQSTTSTSVSYMHNAATAAQVFFYRVRALGTCTNTSGAYSRTIRVVIVPAVVNRRNPHVNVPAGSIEPASFQVFIPGESVPVNFTISVDRPWILMVDPSSGILPVGGLLVTVTVDPAQLPNGTFTASLIVVTTPLANSGRVTTNGSGGKSVPITINLVTPVVPNSPSGPTENSLIIPVVGHQAGLNSQWRSDIRIYNASPQALKYLLNFTPQGSSDVKQTTLTTASNDTTALDDIIHNWFGVGEVGDSSTGVLEIRPMTLDGSTTPPQGSSFTTVASSRTFNETSTGTLGQFIPPVKFTNFIGTGSRMSLQQLAQSSSYRTNFGLVEASGSPVSLLLSMFSSSGSKLFDLPVNLAAGEQKLLNGLLASQGVNDLSDGRMEVSVVGGNGKVTGYASVIDNASLDPQLVPGQNLTNTSSQLYVVPGVADLNNGLAKWRTDMRVYNSGQTAQTANLTFFAQDQASQPLNAAVTVNPGEVKVLDGVLQSLFSTHDVGGMVQLTTATGSQLVVTARTFNQTSNGTLGQFIKAATAADGITNNARTLNILQVEDSPRFRTNVGLAEMSGQPVTVEVSLVLPDSKLTPSIQVPLAANEFRQFGVADFGLGDIYNVRVSVKVVGGGGSVTAYGSVIDQVTTDPTYVQAQ